jgi:putative sterol carrier protein
VFPPDLVEALKPSYVAPLVAYLCHDSCDSNGQIFEVGGGWVSQARIERTAGALFPLNQPFTPETIAAKWGDITRFDEKSQHPSSGSEAFANIMGNLETANAPATDEAPAAADSKAEARLANYKATALFQQLHDLLQTADARERVKSVKALFAIELKNGDDQQTWTIDLKNKFTCLPEAPEGKADVTLVLSDDNFFKLIHKKVNAQNLFMQGKLKLKGNMGLAMKFESVLKKLGVEPAPRASM